MTNDRLEEILWEMLCLLTGSTGEYQSAGLIRLRAELARNLGKYDPSSEEN